MLYFREYFLRGNASEWFERLYRSEIFASAHPTGPFSVLEFQNLSHDISDYIKFAHLLTLRL